MDTLTVPDTIRTTIRKKDMSIWENQCKINGKEEWLYCTLLKV